MSRSAKKVRQAKVVVQAVRAPEEPGKEGLRNRAGRRWLPAGFETGALLAWALVGVGAMRLLVIPTRWISGTAEPHPFYAAALGLLLLGGGVVLLRWMGLNSPSPGGRHDAADTEPRVFLPRTAPGTAQTLGVLLLLLLAASPALLPLFFGGPPTVGVHSLLAVLGGFPLQSGVLAGGMDFAHRAAVLAAGSLFVGLGSVAVALLVAATWLATHPELGPGNETDPERRDLERFVFRTFALPRAAIATAAGILSVPYFVPALLVRGYFGEMERWAESFERLEVLDLRAAFVAGRAQSIGFFFAVLWLGLQAGRELCRRLDLAWLDDRDQESSRVARVAGRSDRRIFLRDSLWLRRRRELGSLLFALAATAVLFELISTALIESFQLWSYPLYPSLGAALRLERRSEGGAFDWLGAAFEGEAVGAAHAVLLLAASGLLVFSVLPSRRARAAVAFRAGLPDGKLLIPALFGRGKELASDGVPRLDALGGERLVWVAGPSGTGKSSLLRAWAEHDAKNSIYLPQDPDEALPPELSLATAMRLAGSDLAQRVKAILQHLGDRRLESAMDDSWTSVARFSRGERQRLAFALARAAADDSKVLLLDELTSAQDAARGEKLWALADVTAQPATRSGGGLGLRNTRQTVVISQDPSRLDVLHRGRSKDRRDDRVVWFLRSAPADGRSRRVVVRAFSAGGERPEEDDRTRLARGQFEEWLEAAGQLMGGNPQAQPVEDENDDSAESSNSFGSLDAPRRPRVERPSTVAIAASPWSEASPVTNGALSDDAPVLEKCALDMGGRTLLIESPIVRADLEGRLVFLRGASGFGKSRLLRHLLDVRSRELPNVAFGYVAQDPGRAFAGDELTGREVLDGLTIKASELGLAEEQLYDPVELLSEGERQRLLLGRELARMERRRPGVLSVLVLDEPFSSIDPPRQEEFAARIIQWLCAEPRRKAVLLVSHLPEKEHHRFLKLIGRRPASEVRLEHWAIA